MSNLSESAMLVSVTISQWSGRKLDAAVTAEVNRSHGASADAGRYNKSLIANDALASILAISNRARKIHYARSLPWLDNGARIMSAAGYLEFAKELRDVSAEFDAAVSDFVGNYSAYVEAARVRLNGMFKETDYPAASDIASRFRFEKRIWPLPSAADFRVTVGEGEQAIIRAEIEAQTRDALNGAMADAFKRVAEHVGNMAAKLADFKPADGKGGKASGIFRDSLVENVRDLVDVLPSLNITGDAKLADITARMADLCRYDADALRDDTAARQETAAKARQIADDVAAYF